MTDRNGFLPLAAFAFLAAMPAAELGSFTPMLQVTRMTGQLQIRTPQELITPTGPLPYIRPGSEVRVLSGEAWFETSHHALLSASMGEGFYVGSYAPGQGARGGLVIEALEGTQDLRVIIAGSKFRLRSGGSVAIHFADNGVAGVEVLSRPVHMVSGSVLREGESITVSLKDRAIPGMNPGDFLRARVPEKPGFEAKPIPLAKMWVGTRLEQGASVSTLRLRSEPAAPAAKPPEAPVVAAKPAKIPVEREEMRSAVGAVPAGAPRAAAEAVPAPVAPGGRLFPRPIETPAEAQAERSLGSRARDAAQRALRFARDWWIELVFLTVLTGLGAYLWRSEG